MNFSFLFGWLLGLLLVPPTDQGIHKLECGADEEKTAIAVTSSCAHNNYRVRNFVRLISFDVFCIHSHGSVLHCFCGKKRCTIKKGEGLGILKTSCICGVVGSNGRPTYYQCVDYCDDILMLNQAGQCLQCKEGMF
jgi:hypothetical protein